MSATEPIAWSDLPDDLDTLARLSLDLRLSWDDPDPPERIAAWRKWYELKRRERELPRISTALEQPGPGRLDFGPDPDLPPMSSTERHQPHRRPTRGVRLVVTV